MQNSTLGAFCSSRCIEMKFKNKLYPVILAPAFIPEMNIICQKNDGISLGAACTLTRSTTVIQQVVAELQDYQTEVLKAILEQLQWFAGQQIRNVATLGGNIMTASPISDLNPVYMAAGCKLHVASKDGTRLLKMDENFFRGYRKTALEPHEILLSIEIPYTRKGEYVAAYKQATRRDDDIAIVNCGMKVYFKDGTNVVDELKLSYGGMAAITVMPKKTCQRLIGREWNENLLLEACMQLAEEMTLSSSTPGGKVEFRRTLAVSFFFKFYLAVLKKLSQNINNHNNVHEVISTRYTSATEPFCKDPSSGVQFFQAVPPGQYHEDLVGRPIMHLSAERHTTGEAIYCDDIPHFENELYLAVVTSTKAHAKIIAIDAEEALKMPGVICFISAKDVPGSNATGHTVYDETVFAEDLVTCVGHIIGAIVADTQPHAQQAAKSVKITYEELKPIITIQDAIENQSFYQPIYKLEDGDVQRGFEEADEIIEGEIYIGGQEHFYLETQCTIAVPREDGEMELFVSTQDAAGTQTLVAKALGVPANRIICRVKRIGGGFGGKESRSTLLSTVVAVAAHKTHCPIRCMLDRDEDMLITGGRHPCLGHYKVGFLMNGKVVSVDVTYYSNAGNSKDFSMSVMQRMLFHMDGTYKIANIRGTGYACKTNLPSNTAFRGFGVPQGMMLAECWINDVSLKCGLLAEAVRRMNLYSEGDLTPFGMKQENITLQRCWEECVIKSNYHDRRKQIEEFNRQHRWKKRGMAIIPTQYGIGFTVSFMNQAGALVHIYKDGSVLLTHGGTEMGQGLHTKMVQVASRVLQIPTEKIFVSETSTTTVPNASPTAASSGSDLNGMAVYNACQILSQRLEPFKQVNPKGTWEDWIAAAYFERVSLSATGFYKIPDIGYNFEKKEGQPYSYFTYGVACSEVEIDCLTGDHKNLRTDIVMDLGNSLNPAIDIGQIEGAFVQGLGLFTLEELQYSPHGSLYTRGPGMYKIPAAGDIPTEFNVYLLRDSPNNKAIYSSKAVGEPPLFLSASVFFAIKDAITFARAESGIKGSFRLDSPATPERIRLACADEFTTLVCI
ncbi:xanthine dehydrogenase/oxidase-like [Protopterus annectens]|uniref:xanthine dehydrogenase/oxidase-like n=1 Tax=Protopterus annectens TaxID=7888 RepID=UPI001CFC177C|nr:xanthine dehydrogenase/oxidase-like [Protopterus annectens]